MATGTPSNVKTAEGDVSVDLPAPAGWKKKFTPKKGATPSKNEIVFIAPDGEEIKSKAQLRGYLKSHPAGVTFKEFDWSTVLAGDTPRRSSRLSGKSKESESPENETPKKRQRKSSSKKATKEKGDGSEDEAPEASDADAKDTVEHVDKDVVTEKDAGEDPVKGGDVGEPAAEEEKAAGEGHEAAPEEQKTDAMELETAAEEQKSDVKEPEASAEEQKSDVKEPEAAAEEQRSDVVKEQEAVAVAAEEQEAVAVEEEKSDVKEQVGGADDEKAEVGIEEVAYMEALLGTDVNEGTDGVNEDVQLEIGDKKEGDQVSDGSKQSNGGGEQKGVENASHPSAVSEEDKQAAEFWSGDDWPISIPPHVPGEGEEEQGPGDFLASLPDDFLDDALAGSAGLGGGDQPKYASSNPKVEETAEPVGEAHKESSSKDEAENQKSVGDNDAAMQEANIEENQQQDPSRGL